MRGCGIRAGAGGRRGEASLAATRGSRWALTGERGCVRVSVWRGGVSLEVAGTEGRKGEASLVATGRSRWALSGVLRGAGVCSVWGWAWFAVLGCCGADGAAALTPGLGRGERERAEGWLR